MTTQATQSANKPETDDELLRRITAAEATKAQCDKNIKQAKAELLLRRKDEIKKLLKEKDEPYGTVTIIVGNHQVVVDTKKKVSWDSKKLGDIYKEMEKDGQRAQDYIDVEYSVAENRYKGWDKDMQDYFRAARTVEPGTISLKLKEEE